jgi:predicted flap endonuclease-1-like 5' DNA nuclease
MTNLAHIAETAFLLLAAYLLGCVVGYAIRMVLHAGRGTRQVTPAVAVAAPLPELRRPRSSAARLAASVEQPAPPPKVAPAPVAGRATTEARVVEPAQTALPTSPAPVPLRSAKSKATEAKPVTLEQPRAGVPDNLKQIKGIGPKIEASLYAMGIFHIDQIAGWTRANVDWVDAQLAFKGRIRRERWVEQALELNAGNTGAPPRLSGRA